MKKIWFIDDDKFNVMIASKIFKDIGLFEDVYIEQYSSKVATAISEFQNNLLPKVLFLDQNMPILKGSEILESMLDKGIDLSQTKCYVMINSEIPPEFKTEKLSCLVADYIKRPLKKEQIQAIVDACL